MASFIKSQGGFWRGLSLETLQRNNCGFLPNVYFPAAGKELPAVVIPNDLGGVYFRAIEGKFHGNNKPMATSTVFIPDAEEFDLFVTEGQVNALSIWQAVNNPKFGIMACSGTSGEKLILDKLQQLQYQNKKFRVILAFDNDSNRAGQNAAVNALNRLSKAGFTAYGFNDHLQFSEKITSMIHYMRENLKTITFSKLAKKFAYSERQLARLLIKYTGKNFIAIMQDLKIQKACLLLKDPNLSIREIILECGCKNQNYFYKLFKKYYGKTPAQYRNIINP